MTRHFLLPLLLLAAASYAQPCSIASAPDGLEAYPAAGSGVLLRWNPVGGSQGVQVKAFSPSGTALTKRLVGVELDQYALLSGGLPAGDYRWQVRATCLASPPFALTPWSVADTFTVSGSAPSCPTVVTDVDGYTYATTVLAGQCWLAENLRVSRYRNGDSIPTGLGSTAWTGTTEGAMTIYNTSPSLGALLGRLYNGFAVTDPRGICPLGWRVPTDQEWTVMTAFLGGPDLAGGALKATGTIQDGTGVWEAPNTGATNSSGFSALPGGERSGISGGFNGKGLNAHWWTATLVPSGQLWDRVVVHDLDDVFAGTSNRNRGASVRCVKD